MGSGAAARLGRDVGVLMAVTRRAVRSSMATLLRTHSLDFAYVISMLSPAVPNHVTNKPTTTTNRQPQQTDNHNKDQIMNLHETLAKLAADPEKRKKQFDSEWFAASQKGTAVITNIVQVEKDGTTNTFLEAKILESHATGKTPAQAPGTKVKKMYGPFKKWWKEELMNDLLNIAGLEGTEGEPVNNYLSSALGTPCGIVGVAFNFACSDPQTHNKHGVPFKAPIVNTRFSEAVGKNEEAMVEARKKEILG